MECIDLKKKFGSLYKITVDPAANPRNTDPWYWVIPAKYGEIYPYGHNWLAAMVTYKLAKQIKQEMSFLEIIQEASDFWVFKFNEKHFEEVAARIGAKKRRQYTPEQLEKARKRAETARKYLAKADKR